MSCRSWLFALRSSAQLVDSFQEELGREVWDTAARWALGRSGKCSSFVLRCLMWVLQDKSLSAESPKQVLTCLSLHPSLKAALSAPKR